MANLKAFVPNHSPAQGRACRIVAIGKIANLLCGSWVREPERGEAKIRLVQSAQRARVERCSIDPGDLLTMNDPKLQAPAQVRHAVEADLDALTELCIRSKAHWGYDQAFMEACREEMTLTLADLAEAEIAVAVQSGEPAAMVQVGVVDGLADLHRLYVDPAFMRGGLGRTLFDWAVAKAKSLGAKAMTIEADPSAAAFYERMGATVVGSAPSGSIPGRELPLLRYKFGQASKG